MRFIDDLSIESVTTANFDEKVLKQKNLTCVFFWGEDCPNCEIAKNVLSDRRNEVKPWGIQWFHANVYQDFELGNRFGLFGIPVFIFFKDGKKLGKISPFPGFSPFAEAIEKLLTKGH